MLLESLCRRFAYEVNTKTGPLSLDMNGRAKLWKEDYDKLKKEVQAESVSVPRFGNGVDGPPYFHTGMHENERVWERMINARFMYLRPGNLFKDFVVESNTQVVTASGKGSKRTKGRRLKDHQRMSC